MFSDFVSLFFPNVCHVCGNALVKGEEVICMQCEFHLPKTGYHLFEDNPVAKNFWGRVNIRSATSLYFFSKGQKLQTLIHLLKYRNCKEIGIRLGKLLGIEIKNVASYSEVDFVLPVPLHKKRIRKRGYNQSELIAEGLGEVLQKPVLKDLLIRRIPNETQTKKSRWQRFENVNEIFGINKSKKHAGHNAKHFLLVDDVVTTGSTLIACAETLEKNFNAQVSIATLACTH